MQQFNTPKLKYLYRLIIFFLFILTAYRLVFLLTFKAEITEFNIKAMFNSFFLGMRFDLRLIMGLILPGIILINLPFNPKFKENLINVFYSFILLILNFLYASDIGHFSYLKSRMNSNVIAFLQNPLISFQMVRESYPWFVILIGIIIVSGFLIWLMKKIVTPILMSEKVSAKTSVKFSRVVLFILVFALSAYGSLHMYPLRWSEAFSTTDAFNSNLSLNPILYVIDTYSFRKTDYDATEVKKYYPIVSQFLGVKNPDINKLNFDREFSGDEVKMKSHPNIVVVIMESMAYFKTGIGGNPMNPTPYLDKLKSESLLFDRFYTPTVATARSVFAAVTSLPDISKVQTGTRNPFIVNQNTIMGQAKGYEKFYFLGGSANWGNIRGILSYNIPELNIYEEGSYTSPRVDVWGISDLDLFKEATKVFNKRKDTDKPFFAIVQSAGFHRPYTFPSNSDDFKMLTEKDVDPKEVQKYFISMDEYNAMRLQDYSLGKFIEMAKKEKWYENTIFLVFGDHGLPHNNAPNVPEWTKFNANGYHVPFIVHSPKYIQPGVETKIASEMDVMPTIAGLIGIPYKTRALGRDLFNLENDKYRAAFSYNWYAPNHISFLDENFYFELIPYNGNTQLIKYTPKDNTENVKDKFPTDFERMNQLAKGLYETAKYLLHHNSKMY